MPKPDRITENAHKIAYLIFCFPTLALTEILDLMKVPPIDHNTAIWKARELGLITDIKNGKLEFIEAPAKWTFGQFEEALEDELLYAFAQLTKTETDLEEHYLSEWTIGYQTQDVLIAMRRLTEKNLVWQYDVTDVDQDGTPNVYQFFTAIDNKGKDWGKKQFKTAPADIPEEDKHLHDE